MSLKSDYTSQENERRLFVRQYNRDISAFIAKWVSSGKTDANYKNQAIRLIQAALDVKGYSPEQGGYLASLITVNGSKDSVNLDLRDACLHFAQLAYLREGADTESTAKVSYLLNKFADLIPDWPIWNPYYETNYANRTQNDPNSKASYQQEFSSGIWGRWIYEDLVMATPLLEAWVLVRDLPNYFGDNSKLNSLFTRFKNIQKWRTEATTPYNLNGQPDYSNQDHFQIRGKIDFGLLWPDPEYLHEGVRHLKNLYKVNFFTDGWWHEGTIAYHSDLQSGIKWLMEDFPTVYSDPVTPHGGFFRNSVDGTRFDNMSLQALMSTYSSRANNLMSFRYPDNSYIAVGDSIYNSFPNTNQRGSNPLTPERITPSPSKLFGAMGQGVVCLGPTGNETMVTLHWGAYNTHQHYDCLNLNVWSKNQEVISETHYNAVGNSTREWNTSTPGHVTVTVNRTNQAQTGVHADNRRTSTTSPLDKIKNIPDWGWRWNASSGTDYGKLRLFNTEFDSVKVIEADGPSAYSAVISGISKYRRTVALVKIDDNDCYIADIFRVKGGTCHDFWLHSCLHKSHRVAVSTTPTMSTSQTGSAYPGASASSGLDKLSRVKGITTDSAWSAVFTPDLSSEKWILKSFFTGATSTNVIEAQAPAMRITGNAPFVCARRNNSDSVFISVHHPINKTGSYKVTSISSLTGTSTDVVAFKVVLSNGRTDTIISGESLTSSSYVDGRINFIGSFGHLSETTSPTADNQWMYLIDGSTISVGTKSITGSVSITGNINSITRIEAGSTANTFVTTNALPTGSSLNNYTLLIDPEGLPRWGYKIDSVSVTGSNYIITTLDEPGLKIDSDATGQYTKQEYFPNWGYYGTVNYKVPGSARLVRGTSGVWDFYKVGSVTGTTT